VVFSLKVICTIHEISPSDQDAAKLFGSQSGDVFKSTEKSGHFQTVLNNINQRGDPNLLLPYYNATGCLNFPLNFPPDPFDRQKWPNLCMFSKIVRSLVVGGPTGRLQRERGWLLPFYVGPKDRFDAALSAEQSKVVELSKPDFVFDVAIHLRTLALIESYETEDGRPVDPKGKAAAFIRSAKFESMVKCLAEQIRAGLEQRRHEKGMPRPLDRHSSPGWSQG
jgi:hypothetical protein